MQLSQEELGEERQAVTRCRGRLCVRTVSYVRGRKVSEITALACRDATTEALDERRDTGRVASNRGAIPGAVNREHSSCRRDRASPDWE